jgi:hypothetical protein
MPVVVGAGGRANYYCGTCRQSGIGEAFRLQHAHCENVEALQFTAINSSAEPDTLEDILKELEAAEKDDALIVPDLEFVRQILRAVGSIDVSGLCDGTEAPMHDGVNKMLAARELFEDQLSTDGSVSEIEAAMAALMVSQQMSQSNREEWCKFLADRSIVPPGCPARMSAEKHTDMVPGFKKARLNTSAADTEQFGELEVLYRDIIEVVWSVLTNPAFSLDKDLATEFEKVFDEESEESNDIFRGGSFPEVHNALWFKVLRLRLPNGVLPIAVFLASDATNLVNVGTKSGHGLYLIVINLRASARQSPYAIKLLALYMPPKHGAGVSPAVEDAFRTRYDEYLQQARDLIYAPLRRAAEHGVRLPLPLNGPDASWPWVTCFIAVMGEGGDFPERCRLSCCICGPNAARPCPKCRSKKGSALREPVEDDPSQTTALKTNPRVPRDARAINRDVLSASFLQTRTGQKRMLKMQGARGVPLLTNIPGHDAIASLLVDTMHTLEGVMKRLLEGAIHAVCASLRPREASRRVAELNYRMQLCRAFCGPRGAERLPPINLFQFKSKTGAGLRSQFTAKEFSAACPHLPLVFAPWAQLSKLFQAWAMLYVELRTPTPTWKTLRWIYVLYQHFLKAFDNSTLNAHLKEGIDTPKVHDILHIVHQMICYGCADIASLQQMENAHITWLKRTFKSTDMRAVGFEACITQRVQALEAERLRTQLTGRHYAKYPPSELPRRALDTWREHACLPRMHPPCHACCAAHMESDGAQSAPEQCRDDCTRAHLRRTLRGEGRRAGMPAKMTLHDLEATACPTAVGHCDLEGIVGFIISALDSYPDVLHLVDGASSVSLSDSVVPYTSARVRGAGRDMCVEMWATARPGRGRPGSEATFDFVSLAAATDAAVDEVYGLLALIFTCSSVDEPLCLLKMLRRAPLGVGARCAAPPCRRHVPFAVLAAASYRLSQVG